MLDIVQGLVLFVGMVLQSGVFLPVVRQDGGDRNVPFPVV